MKKYFIIILSLLFSFCATFKAERKLDSKTREWYELHSLIMTSKVPYWVLGIKKEVREYQYFLKLPSKLQKLYIEHFWDIRGDEFITGDDLKKEFYERVKQANIMCRLESRHAGWRTDRGRIIVIAGLPDYVDSYKLDPFTEELEPYFLGDEEWDVPFTDENQPKYFLIWSYWKYENSFRNQLIRFKFFYAGHGRWRLVYESETEQRAFLDYRVSLIAPNDNGWARWLDLRKK